MASGTLSPETLSIAYWVEVVLALLALATFLSIFVLRTRTERHKEQVENSRRYAQACLTHWLDNEPWPCTLDTKVATREFLKLWIYHASLLAGEHRQILVRHGKAAGLPNHIAGLLVSASVPDELLALKAGTVMRDESLVQGMLPLLDSKNNVVSLFAAEAIAACSRNHALHTILPRLVTQTNWAEKKVVELYGAIVKDSHEVTRLMLNLVLQQGAKQQAFVAKFLSGQPFELRAPYLSELLRKAKDDKVISACLDGLQEPLSADLARQYLKHPRWHVRVHAVQALGRIGSARDEAALTTSLADEQWWVRYRAAQALVGLPWMSEAALARIYRNLTDRFSRDSLKQAASEAKQTWLDQADAA